MGKLFYFFFFFLSFFIFVYFIFFFLFFCLIFNENFFIKNIAYEFSILLFLLFFFLFLKNFDTLILTYYLVFSFPINFGINYTIGIDAISILFLILLFFLNYICIFISWDSIKYRFNDFVFLNFLVFFVLLHVFSALDLFLFFFSFEMVLIPMFLIIGLWGSRQRKIHASIQFFFFTMLGSLWFFVSILLLYIYLGTTDIFFFFFCKTFLSSTFEKFVWISFFLSFAVKVPVVPVHIWLPEAHVEAPTAGSVLLAGVLLKMGGYGILRFMLNILNYSNFFFLPLVFLISLISLIYSSFVTIRQVDLKKIIAYSSVAHMNLIMLGLFSFDFQGVFGGFFLMLSHGLVSSALFYMVGILYDRYHTRILFYFGRLVDIMPIFCFFFFFFNLANMGFPGTSSFVGEFLILSSLFFKLYYFVCFVASCSTILAAVYSIWFFNRICFFDSLKFVLTIYSDLNKREFLILSMFLILVIFFGIYPASIFYKVFFFFS